MDIIIFIVTSVIFLGLILIEYFLLKKHYESGIKELETHYKEVVKETERKTRETCFKESLKESIEVKHTLVPTEEYIKTIIVDHKDISLLNDEKELMEILRSGFADQFAKEVIKPNLNIHEIMDMDINLHGKKKYFTKIRIGF